MNDNPARPAAHRQGPGSSDRIVVTYRLELAKGADPEARALDVAREQTVELPAGGYPPELDSLILGRIEEVTSGDAGSALARITYDPVTAGDDLLQLLNLLYGNISMMTDVRVVDVELPDSILTRFRGPRFGMAGLRALTAAPDSRAMVVGAAKPMGLSSSALADRCAALARAGVDIVKDDHGVTNQPAAPFRERVARCQDAVEHANSGTGGATRYFPNVTAAFDEIGDRVEFACSVGCRGVLVSPMLTGLDAVRWIAANFDLAVLAHPTFTGGFYGDEGGMSAEVLYGLLFRVAGSDGVIYTNAGGRFPLDEETCVRINERLRRPMGDVRPSLPIAGGGVDAARVPYWIDRYGEDMGFLVGSSLYAQPDLESAARELVEVVLRHGNGP